VAEENVVIPPYKPPYDAEYIRRILTEYVDDLLYRSCSSATEFVYIQLEDGRLRLRVRVGRSERTESFVLGLHGPKQS